MGACCGQAQEQPGKRNLENKSAPLDDSKRKLADVLKNKGYAKAASYDEVIQAYEEKPAM